MRQFCSRVQEQQARRVEENSSVTASVLPPTTEANVITTTAKEEDYREDNCGAQLVDVSDLSHEMRACVHAYTRTLATAHRAPPRMVGILASSSGDDAEATAAEKYSNAIASTFAQDGLEYHLHRCIPETVEDCIRVANEDPNVHGILVFYPIFPRKKKTTTRNHDRSQDLSHLHLFLNPQTGTYYQSRDDYLRDCVTPTKDVEGLCRESRQSRHRLLFRARGGLHKERHCAPNKLDIYIPCTAQAVFQILERYHDWGKYQRNSNNKCRFHEVHKSNIDNNISSCPTDFWSGNYSFGQERWKGCTVTVINRSSVFGRPLSALLALEGATVYSVDDRSILQFQNDSGGRRCCRHMSLADCLRESEVIVTAVPRDDFCLDADAVQDYATIVDVSEQSNVNVEHLQRRGIQLITNIGKMTVAALEQNLVRLHEQNFAKQAG